MTKQRPDDGRTARILDVLVDQTHEDGRVLITLGVSWQGGDMEFSATLTDPEGNTLPFSGGHAFMDLTVESPLLWQPRGYGEQPLYALRVEAKADGRVMDAWERRIGLRTAALSIEKDPYGESFAQEINGVKIFAMGASVVPGPGEEARRLLEDAAAANFNCVRALGVCPDSFYDACDELGLMVWQDFAFTGLSGELTTELANSIREQVRNSVKRLRHHPSIVLWCGNDGMELSASGAAPRQRADYIRLFEYIIPTELRKTDPAAVYWPSSPSSGGGFDEPDSLSRGDAHPRCSDTRDPGRYVSSFGTPSCPCLTTVESFTRPGERNLFSRAMEERSECRGSTAHIMANIQRFYLCPTSFDTLIYASQLAGARIVSRAALHYRRHRGRCMGALYRQLNHSCQGVSCSSIDCSGRWKALHYFARRFFAPLLLSLDEGDMLDADSGTQKSIQLCVTNDTNMPRAVLIKWALRDSLCRVIREETISLTVPPLESVWLDRIFLPKADISGGFISYTLYEKGAPISFGTALFVPPKYYEFRDPGLLCRVEGDEIVVASEAYAQGVEIRNAGEDLILSDNYFDMLPGERRVRILRGRPEGLRLRSVYDIK